MQAATSKSKAMADPIGRLQATDIIKVHLQIHGLHMSACTRSATLGIQGDTGCDAICLPSFS
jgi:hypothetical protein